VRITWPPRRLGGVELARVKGTRRVEAGRVSWKAATNSMDGGDGMDGMDNMDAMD
jgi:hypothetical protein